MDIEEPRPRALGLRGSGLGLGKGGSQREGASDSALAGLGTDLGDGRPATERLA